MKITVLGSARVRRVVVLNRNSNADREHASPVIDAFRPKAARMLPSGAQEKQKF